MSETDAATSRQVDFHVQGMDCPDCALRIEGRLRKVDGVRNVEGHPMARRLRVTYDGDRVDPDRIREEVGRLGYVAREDRALIRPSPVWTGARAWRTYVSAALFTVALLLLLLDVSPLLATLPFAELRLPGLVFVLSAAVGGWNFFPDGVRAARSASLDMSFLMTVAILGAVGIGEYLEGAAIAFLFSTAELLERYAVDRARQSLESLLELAPSEATVLRGGREVRVAAEEVREGELLLVRPGERLAADGRVVEGASAVDESPITGESMPAEKTPGDEVFAGTINRSGFLKMTVERAAGDTTLAHIIHLVEEAESRRAPSERFVERFARRYTPAVTAGAVLVAAVPPLLFGAPFAEWFVRGLTLLVIACPCALVISTPVAVVSGITAAARNGVLIKGGTHFERLGEVEVVAFDKTGTLTRGHPRVTDVRAAPGRTEEDVLAWAAAVEARSEHPVARAVVQEARQRGVENLRGRVTGFEAMPGRGVRALVDGRECRVGRPEAFAPGSPELPPDLRAAMEGWREEGKTAVLVGSPDEPWGAVAVGDEIRAEAREAIRELRRGGLRRMVLLTGDDERTARAVAERLGFDEVHAGLLPEEKVAVIQRLKGEAGPVAMVGDGVNDAPALAAADVGIAMGAAGSDAALETADVALMGDRLSRLPYLFQLSRRGGSVIRQNVSASLLIKFALAAGVPVGAVSLIVAVLVGDMGASLGVTANSMRLARLRPGPATATAAG